MERIDNPKNAWEILKNYWHGHGSLSVAYWKFGVMGNFILLFIACISFFFLIPAVYEEKTSMMDHPAVGLFFYCVYLIFCAYQLFVWYLVWKNARNAKEPFWGWLAQAQIISGIYYIVEFKIAQYAEENSDYLFSLF